MSNSSLEEFDHLIFLTASPFSPRIHQSSQQSIRIPKESKMVTVCSQKTSLNISFEKDHKQAKKIAKSSRIHAEKIISKKAVTHLLTERQKILHGQSRLKKNMFSEKNLNLLEIKSVELDKQLKQISQKKRHASKNRQDYLKDQNSKQEQYLKNLQNPIIPFIQYSANIQPKLNRENCAKILQKQDIIEKSNTKIGYYERLKQKVRKEVQKIKDKTINNKINLLVQGCQYRQIKNDHKDNKDRFLSDRPRLDRPKSCKKLTKTGLHIQDLDDKPSFSRALSSRSRNMERKELYKSQKINTWLENHRNRKNKKQNTSKRYKSLNESFNSDKIHQKSTTFNHIKQIYKQTNIKITKKMIQIQKNKQDMLSILYECHIQSDKQNKLKKGIKLFEQYSKKMSNNLNNATQLLNQIQNMSNNSQDL